MRVISGSRKGMPLKAVSGMNTRPTSDKVKESIFNMIGPYFDGGTVVDLFGGSGGLSIEALSRGCELAIIIEKDANAFSVIMQNLAKCRFEGSAEVFRTDAKRAVKALLKRNVMIDLLFLDPPYKKAEQYNLISDLVDGGLINENGLIVCEHDPAVELPDAYGAFSRSRHEVYGSTAISIYSRER